MATVIWGERRGAREGSGVERGSWEATALHCTALGELRGTCYNHFLGGSMAKHCNGLLTFLDFYILHLWNKPNLIVV